MHIINAPRPSRDNSPIIKLHRSTQVIITVPPCSLAEIHAKGAALEAIAFILPAEFSMEKSGEQE